jgi:hypothetical protein
MRKQAIVARLELHIKGHDQKAEDDAEAYFG